VHLITTIQKVTSNVQNAPHQSPGILTRQTVLEDRFQYNTVHIPNVFCDGHLQIINCVGIVCVYVCMYVCMYVCVYIYIYIYAFLWVMIPRRLNFVYRRFETLSLFHLHRQVGMKMTGVEECWDIYMGKGFARK
jgi:hypothetical protein